MVLGRGTGVWSFLAGWEYLLLSWEHVGFFPPRTSPAQQYQHCPGLCLPPACKPTACKTEFWLPHWLRPHQLPAQRGTSTLHVGGWGSISFPLPPWRWGEKPEAGAAPSGPLLCKAVQHQDNALPHSQRVPAPISGARDPSPPTWVPEE